MTELAAQIRVRVLDALRHLTHAEQSGDHFSADIHRADLENIARIAREHGLRIPELDAPELLA